MKIAFSALFLLLLFAFSTQHLTVAAEVVVDIYGNPVVSGQGYRILDAKNISRGIGIRHHRHDPRPTTVIIGSAPKILTLHGDDVTINVAEKTGFKFAEVPPSAELGEWKVWIRGLEQYPVVIGPTDNIVTMPGWFDIAKSGDSDDVYYINFKIGGKDDYALMTKTNEKEDFYRMVFCPDALYEKLSVVFEPLTPPPKPPKQPPALPSTFAPHIRKVVR